METIDNRDNLTIGQIKADAQEAISNWNGDTPDGEDRANIAEDILEAVRNLEELLAEL